MMRLRIEDDFEDVLMKAATGLGLGKQALAQEAGISVAAVAALLDAELNEANLRAVAPVLGLDADALAAMANRAWQPEPIELEGLRCYTTPFPVTGYQAMTVNSYLVWSPLTKVAVAFDTGANVEALLAEVEALSLDLQALVVTHVHRDHIAAYDELLSHIEGGIAFAPKLEPYGEADLLEHGDWMEFDGFEVQARQTNGHSAGGMSYVIEGLGAPIAIVGDSIFCLSQGGAAEHYAQALDNNREQILSLPESTILCPGHGPMTTVANEQAHNPFFPEFK
ncbi:MAG: MBL fold metallo-hydrolase [Opitutales bacterium]|jgi:hydroxyacylglutathione hydrolase|tara:strand:- start:137 stop:976 length:840 start_codon:yes stop_codon:yes gene_type:complete